MEEQDLGGAEACQAALRERLQEGAVLTPWILTNMCLLQHVVSFYVFYLHCFVVSVMPAISGLYYS